MIPIFEFSIQKALLKIHQQIVAQERFSTVGERLNQICFPVSYHAL